MIDEMSATHDRAPKRHLTLVSRLRVDAVGDGRVARAIWQAESPGDLPARLRCFRVLGRAECRRAAAHVNVGRKASVHDGCAGPNHLRIGDNGENFGGLLHQRTCDRCRAHRTRQRKWRNAARLPRCSEFLYRLGHRNIELHGRVGVDDGEQRRILQARRARSRVRCRPSRSSRCVRSPPSA